MNSYFLKMTKEERENILDKHKTLYDGYSIRNNQLNMTPLYTQDLANDKAGITVNSKGEVGSYNNKLYIKESKDICEQCGSTLFEGECTECGSKMYEEENCEQCGKGEMGEGIYDFDDINNEENRFDYIEREMDESFIENLKGAFGYKSKPDIKPYTADAVQTIISNIKKAKTEEQLDSALNMYFNLINTNRSELNKAYVERIMGAYKRKADELENYLGKKDIENIMGDVEPELEFREDVEKVKESIKESLNWFNRFKKYN